ncbi:hypothetical protein Tco_0332403 [Tanacetum coccineum]
MLEQRGGPNTHSDGKTLEIPAFNRREVKMNIWKQWNLQNDLGCNPLALVDSFTPIEDNIEVLMIDELSIVETDKVIHTMETDMVKLVVEIECFGKSFDEFDKGIRSSDGLQPKQADLSCVHALNEPHLHEIHVVPNKHEADQCHNEWTIFNGLHGSFSMLLFNMYSSISAFPRITSLFQHGKEDGIFISQYKYVTEILKKFGFSDVKTASTPMETHKPLLKDADGEDVAEHLYRSMIGSLMYLTSSRPDIMFAVCQPKLGIWYPKDSPFDLEAFTDSDYVRASLDRKSTIGGCQFLGCRLISWQCKKQTVVVNSTTEAEYIATSNYCGQ